MLQKDKERDKITETNDLTTPGHVKQICQNFSIHADSGLAYRLQKEEFEQHFDRNRTHRRDSRLGVKTARDVEEEEKQRFIAKKFEFYQEKQKIEENDIALARQLQDEIKIQSYPMDRTTSNTPYQSFSDNQKYYEEIDQSSISDDTSNDEQLARILQEEEDEEHLLSSSAHHSHFNSTFV